MYLTKYYYETKLPSGESVLVNFLTGKRFFLQEPIRNLIKNWVNLGDTEAKNFLVNHNFLFKDKEEELLLIEKKIEQYHKELDKNPTLYGLCLTYDCNLRCPYCYENGIGRKNTIMSKESIRQILQGIAKRNEQLQKEHSLVVLFGGEPFMECNREAVQYFFEEAERFCKKEKASGRNSRIVLFSNGFELAGFLPLLERYKGEIDSVMLTLNGIKPIHDSLKRSPDGESSFERTSDVIAKLLEMGILVNVRCDVDKSNIRWLPQVADYVMERGWSDNPLFRYYISPIKWYDPAVCLSEGGLLKSFVKLDGIYGGKLSRVFELGALRIVHNISSMFESQSDNSKIAYLYCEAVKKQQYIFGTDGYLYKCLSSIGKPELAFGEYKDGIRIYEDKEERWSARNVLRLPKCRECRFAFICGGGCALQAEKSGNFYDSECEDVKNILDVYLNAKQKGSNVRSYGFYYDEEYSTE